ncbi:GNAT family N-acetyltransferase [Bradyrhizobium prioriisuperbiae]|uniref:GNAT family N-acetyltransferase n=1 Tax=Bradyrhizobium prioriisuperbiae TaxID=2854389 RepID=UPI0028E46474|nr:GNAT family N-acetyltransferase [Bradyrhizobium prioritasuperba]
MDDIDRAIPEALGPRDAIAGLALTDEVGWNQGYEDWLFFLTNGTVFGLRDGDGRLVATAALLPYPPAAWISMVLVTASKRRRGLARRLMEVCIAAAGRAGLTPWLDATPAGATVYGPMGFHPTLTVQRFRRRDARTSTQPAAIRPDSGTLADLIRRDRDAMDFDRSVLLGSFNAREGTRLYARDSALCLVREGRKARQIGPLFADHAADAIALLDGIVVHEDGPHIIDLVDDHHDVIRHLIQSGWINERPFQRMRLGGPPSGGHEAGIAIAGPEFG